MVDNSGTTVVVEAAVWVRTANGWRRAFGRWDATPATVDREASPAVWEVSIREEDNGLHELAMVPDEEVGAVFVAAPEWRPSRRDQLAAIAEQAEADVVRARARLQARAPVGWTPRVP